MFNVRPSEIKKGVRYCSWQCRKTGMRGENHPGWKADAIRDCYRGPNWKETRQSALERDGHKCVKCGNLSKLVVHHIVPWDETQDNRLDNLMTLCIACHMQIHGQMRKENA
jgi:5-methylcytosine-specific restriction endonuclease McrA